MVPSSTAWEIKELRWKHAAWSTIVNPQRTVLVSILSGGQILDPRSSRANRTDKVRKLEPS